MTRARLTRASLGRDALDVARDLLGAELVRDGVVLRIVEVEAYRGPWDTGSHTRMGRTARNAPMWGPPGHAYVYLCYGVHHLLNVVCGPEGEGAAVLVRGAEVVAGRDVVAARRGGRLGPGRLAGPGKVAQALGVDVAWSGHDLLAPGGLRLRPGSSPAAVVHGPRVGIDYADPQHRDAPWRLACAASRQVSRRRDLVPVPGAP